jgi:hypothetical protein
MASAQEYREGYGSELVYQCRAYVRNILDPDGSRCLGYVDGFLDGRTSSPRAGNHLDMTRTFCLTDASLDTVIRVYLAFMEKNPKYLDYEKWKTLTMALHDAYPCK